MNLVSILEETVERLDDIVLEWLWEQLRRGRLPALEEADDLFLEMIDDIEEHQGTLVDYAQACADSLFRREILAEYREAKRAER
jgi:hypothetical protein